MEFCGSGQDDETFLDPNRWMILPEEPIHRDYFGAFHI